MADESNRLFHGGIRVVTLCGSERFREKIDEWCHNLTFAGYTIYSLLPKWHTRELTEDEKSFIDLVHLSKIEESDAIFVVNVDGYIGDTVFREIRWASLRGKEIWFLEPVSSSYLEKIVRTLPQS